MTRKYYKPFLAVGSSIYYVKLLGAGVSGVYVTEYHENSDKNVTSGVEGVLKIGQISVT